MMKITLFDRFFNFAKFGLAITIFMMLVFGAHISIGQDTTVQDVALNSELEVVKKYEEQSREKWEKSILELEKIDQTEDHPDDSILFIGSSSVRLWKTIEEDMAPYHPIRRGYGGAKYSDLAVFAERLVSPHKFRAVAMFVANDVTGKPADHSPAEVEALVRNILRTIRNKSATAPVFIIEVTPTMSRFKAWDKIREINVVLREIALTSPNTYFVPTAEYYLDDQKKPITDLFVKDQLHLNEAGYDLWGTIIKERLDFVLNKPQHANSK